MQTWQMQEARARMSELIQCAKTQPQEITVHGKSVAVVISRETFDRLSQRHESLLEFMQSSPLYDVEEVVFERDAGLTREIPF